MSSEPLRCEGCGAPLDAPAGRLVVKCTYCGHEQKVTSTEHRGESDAEVTERLMNGYDHDVGDGSRRGYGEMKQRDWRAPEHGVWPVDGEASSCYADQPKAVIGPPRLYPRKGAEDGTWYPGARVSKSEWIEATYAAETPAVSKIRVFETSVPGSTYAVTVRESPDGAQQTLWQRPPVPDRDSDPLVLEVVVDPPRRLHAVRAYVVNDGPLFTAIDTIGLVAAQPLPVANRTAWPNRGQRVKRVLRIIVGLMVLCIGVWYGLRSRGEAAPPPPPSPSAGSKAAPRSIDVDGLAKAGTVWATNAKASSEYGGDGFTADEATGPPDVFPGYADDKQSWASYAANDGQEWLEVSWDHPVSARALVVVETFHPGTLVAVDDVSGSEPVTLWQGSLPASTSSRVVEIDWPKRRSLTRIRLTFDTTRVDGWTQIDAVGAVPTW